MDDGELFFEYSQSESVALDDGRIKSAAFDTTQGFGLRAVAGEAAGYAHASELSEAAIRRAATAVRAVASGHQGTLAEPPAGTNRALYTDLNPLGMVDLARQDAAAGRDRRLCPRPRPARQAGHGLALRRLAGGADHAPRRPPRRRHPAAGAAQRGDRGRRGRPHGNRLARRRRPRHPTSIISTRRTGRRRSTRRCARRWSISARCRRRPAR